MPRTALGKRSVWLMAVFWVLFGATQIIAAIGRSQGAFEPERTGFYSVLFPVMVILAGLAGVAALVTGVGSIAKFKERSWLVYLSSLIGLLVTLFIFGEILVPH